MWKLFKIVKFIYQNQLIAAKRTKENKKIENRYGSSVTDKKNRENKPKYNTTKKDDYWTYYNIRLCVSLLNSVSVN